MSYLGIPDADLLSQSVFLSYSVLSICSDGARSAHPHKGDAHLGVVLSTFGGWGETHRSLLSLSQRYLRTSQCLAVRENVYGQKHEIFAIIVVGRISACVLLFR